MGSPDASPMPQSSRFAIVCSCFSPSKAFRLTSPSAHCRSRSASSTVRPSTGSSTDVRLNTCSAEDLVVLKAFADRSRDWADIEGVLLRSGNRLVWETVEAELEPLCEAKEAPHILPRLRALRASP